MLRKKHGFKEIRNRYGEIYQLSATKEIDQSIYEYLESLKEEIQAERYDNERVEIDISASNTRIREVISVQSDAAYNVLRADVWRYNEKIHRPDGPAIKSTFQEEWRINGVEVDSFEKILKEKSREAWIDYIGLRPENIGVVLKLADEGVVYLSPEDRECLNTGMSLLA